MRILVFQHALVEHPGTLCEFWTEGGHRWDTVEFDTGEQIPDLNHFDGGLRPKREALRS